MITLIVLLILVGAVGGFLAGLLGIGGGLVFVPALYFVLSDMSIPDPMLQAIATSLVAATLTGLRSARAHAAAQYVNWDSVKRIGPSVAIGAVVGAWLVAGVLEAEQLQLSVAGLQLLAALLLLAGGSNDSSVSEPNRPRRLFEVLTSLPIGVASAVMGIAGGTWLVPMQTLTGIPIHRAVATAAVAGVLLATVGAASMIVSTHGAAVQWRALAPLCVASLLFAPVGAHLAHRLPARLLRQVFGGFLIVTSLLIIGGIK